MGSEGLDSSNAAMAAGSFDNVCGIAVFEGNNSTVSTICVPFVFVM
jgi:hypothetical protein